MHNRKIKEKLKTVQPLKSERAPILRQITESAVIAEYEYPEKQLKDFKKFSYFPSTYDSQHKTTLRHKIGILDQMGFGGLLHNKIECSPDYLHLLKRRFSIGITDFWNCQNREKFLREKGYMDTYKKLQEQVVIKEIKRSSSIIKPDLPHIMDSHTKRRGSVCNDVPLPYQVTRSARTESIDYDSQKSGKTKTNKVLLEPIDKLMGQCNDLLIDSSKLKKNTEKLKIQLKQELQTPKKKVKVSKKDKCRINFIVDSLT